MALGWTLALALALVLGGLTTAARADGAVVICHGSLAAAQVPLAGIEGYYAAEGLDVQTRFYPSGFQALAAMLAGDCSLSTAAVPPVVYQSLRRDDFRILAALSHSGDYERILARRDRGIATPADLRGHRIAVARATSAHYFLDMFLAAHGLTPSDVNQVFLPAAEVGPALLSGAVDAAAHWEPNIRDLSRELGDRAQVLGFSGLVVSPFLLLVREAFVDASPGVVRGILLALLRADRTMAEVPDEAARRLAPSYGVSAEDFNFVSSLHDFGLRIDQPLPFVLENAARWQIGLLPAAERPPMPNFTNLIDARPLRALRPQSVTLVD
ncbi:MAG TPA: NrtA/SsuA/CpmA family ABC transporter substrate-binding protein [Lamprocystis sp. (in: g-proteobacteria)]|nr:NrtA/SsuA/CpmA family ABC transporter substrate-binding protein [Lamprocystis sp. (in: g-proteobacteria)]